jgi:hypothetical protein
MKAYGEGSGKGRATVTGRAAMQGASSSSGRSRGRLSGLVHIAARGFSTVFGKAPAPPHFFLLFARSIAAFFGRAWIFRPRNPITAPSRQSSTSATSLTNTTSAPARTGSTTSDSLSRTVTPPPRR